jgi:hypothetical protein
MRTTCGSARARRCLDECDLRAMHPPDHVLAVTEDALPWMPLREAIRHGVLHRARSDASGRDD